MERTNIAIVGGGASGLFLAAALQNENITLFERADRVGKKLSATGNGQGNITNLAAGERAYFATQRKDALRAEEIVRCYPPQALIGFFEKLGVLLCADERGRVYPASRQASALTDALRFSIAQKGVDIRLSTQIAELQKTQGGFILTANNGEKVFAKKVVLCAGGKAAKNFGTDGTAYALAQSFGHTVTPLYPSLVQIKTDTAHIKALKGIRVADGGLTARFNGETVSLVGDILFTDYGISGDAVFRISAFIAHLLPSNKVELSIDFLPKYTEEAIYQALCQKRAAFPALAESELLFGVVNNQIGRAVCKRAGGDLRQIAKLVKGFPLTACGSLGFDYAQVTKGGIPMNETDEYLQSRLVDGLYFAGEMLDIDGECGGFNLQWAFSSAMRVAEGLNE